MINDDIYFYDFDFNLLHILPQNAQTCGYSSINATINLNNSGALEIVFCDEDLIRIVEANANNIIVIWRDFQGFLTSYKFTEKESRLFGMHLNGLLHRAVIQPLSEKTDTAENVARTAVSGIDWLTLGQLNGQTNPVTYETSNYLTADAFIQNLLALDSAGYRIRADISNKKFLFEVISHTEKRLIISENNLNAYDFEVVYNNKELAFGGWYKEKQPDDADGNSVEPIWKYVTIDDSKSGIYKIDKVLSAETKTEALNELAKLKSKYEISTKTRNIEHNTDYSLGDVVRVQKDNITSKRLISGINMWKETSYGEEPILNEFEEG